NDNDNDNDNVKVKNKKKFKKNEDNWSIYYSSFLGLKYVLTLHWQRVIVCDATEKKEMDIDMNMNMNMDMGAKVLEYVLRTGLRHASEDVVNMASQVLVCNLHGFISYLQADMDLPHKHYLRQLFLSNWMHALQKVDVYSAASISILSVTHGVLLTFPQLFVHWTLPKTLQHSGNDNNNDNESVIDKLIKVLVSLLEHTSLHVKKQVTATLHHFLKVCAQHSDLRHWLSLHRRRLYTIVFTKLVQEAFARFKREVEVGTTDSNPSQEQSQSLNKDADDYKNNGDDYDKDNDALLYAHLRNELQLLWDYLCQQIKTDPITEHKIWTECFQKLQEFSTFQSRSTEYHKQHHLSAETLDKIVEQFHSQKLKPTDKTQLSKINVWSTYETPHLIIVWNVVDDGSRLLAKLLATSILCNPKPSESWLQIQNQICLYAMQMHLPVTQVVGWKRILGCWLLSDVWNELHCNSSQTLIEIDQDHSLWEKALNTSGIQKIKK
ncbi:hypothetical protein RFI_24097, partial [Reticulomyxa filosa]